MILNDFQGYTASFVAPLTQKSQ